MIRRVSLLGLAIAAAAIAIALTLSGGPTHAVGAFEVPDPVGDTLGKGPFQHDIVLVSGSTDGANLILTVDFADTIAPPSAPLAAPSTFGDSRTLGEVPSEVVVGYVDFDTDQNPDTEIPLGPPVKNGAGISGGVPGSHVTQYCPVPSGMGVDAYLNVGGYDGGSGTAPLVAGGPPLPVPVSFGATWFTATIPLSAIGGDVSFNFGMVLGNSLDPTDCAPGDGGNIKPDLSKPTPTATPTGTPPAPEPSATVAATVIAPDTGGGGSAGSAPLLPWALAASGALVVGASAAVWAYRRRGA